MHEKGLGREQRKRSLYRELNERIVELYKELALDSYPNAPIGVVCECGLAGCMRPIEIPFSEFEAIRAGPTRWVVSTAHIDELAGSIIARRDGYAFLQHAPVRHPGHDFDFGKEAPSPRTADLSKR